ncbi:hypothetical protein HYX16_06575 [Candidatus Woesearchaeota archaeon]|nr:hypothetical protein [Candidatus Woesearchaeota archaeon]
MEIELLNPYVVKILIAAREEDSISSISKRINLSYGWTHKWIKELIKQNVFTEKWKGIKLNRNSRIYLAVLDFIKKNFCDISFYYSVLDLFGIYYCFTKTDAVYIWTGGRYNIARFKEYYPIFIKIKKEDYNIFLWYCKKLNLRINSKKNIFFVPEKIIDFKRVKKNSIYVEHLSETVKFMKRYIYNFEPALEIIEELYKKRFNVKYREINMYKK